MYGGKLRRSNKQKRAAEDDIRLSEENAESDNELLPGMLVACVSSEYSHRPLIDNVEEIRRERVIVHWYESGRGNAKSGHTVTWKPGKIGRGTSARDHKELIDASDIIWQNFHFTPSNSVSISI